MFNIKWDKDQDYSNCYNCSSHFNLLLRKHHCRKCGKIFCIRCLKNYTVFNKQHYVCQNCIVVLNDLILVDKTELYNFKDELTNLRDFFNKYVKRKKNNSTQTINIFNLYKLALAKLLSQTFSELVIIKFKEVLLFL